MQKQQKKNGPEIALTVLIFGHIYRPNILETKIPGFFYEFLICL